MDIYTFVYIKKRKRNSSSWRNSREPLERRRTTCPQCKAKQKHSTFQQRWKLEEHAWTISQLSLVAGHLSVNEKEWELALKTFGVDARDSHRIIKRLTTTLLAEGDHMQYWRHTFCPSKGVDLWRRGRWLSYLLKE